MLSEHIFVIVIHVYSYITYNLQLLLQKSQINNFLQLLYMCTMPQGEKNIVILYLQIFSSPFC